MNQSFKVPVFIALAVLGCLLFVINMNISQEISKIDSGQVKKSSKISKPKSSTNKRSASSYGTASTQNQPIIVPPAGSATAEKANDQTSKEIIYEIPLDSPILVQ